LHAEVRMAVDLREVLDRLAAIESPPRLRTEPETNDLIGKFDQWFDGGALKVVTGWNEYHFANGSLAVVPSTPMLQIEIRLSSGAYIVLSEQSHAPPNIALINA
jgi:hypothetical protein